MGSGLSIEGTLELRHHELDRPVHVRHPGGADRVRFFPPLCEDRLALPRERLLRRREDRGGARLRVLTERVLQREGLPARIANDPVPLALRGLPRGLRGGLRAQDFLKGLGLVQGGPFARHHGSLFKGLEIIVTSIRPNRIFRAE